ncbi:hypothetical protein QR680_008258 [Steinernema hermaphroditum]|uniref:Uncharacterized protein n=1 Tax=Steinernema hermaphroditum TaxID=289476 RepID=A0AA39II58_9BILA|nr:hypothetical protein QR680_008258 [Steinernema hermaphroditum]
MSQNPDVAMSEDQKRSLNAAVRQISLVDESPDFFAYDVVEAIVDAANIAIFQQLAQILKGRGLSTARKNRILKQCDLRTAKMETICQFRHRVEESLRKKMQIPDNIAMPEFKDLRSTTAIAVKERRQDLLEELEDAILSHRAAVEERDLMKKALATVIECAKDAGIPEDTLKQDFSPDDVDQSYLEAMCTHGSIERPNKRKLDQQALFTLDESTSDSDMGNNDENVEPLFDGNDNAEGRKLIKKRKLDAKCRHKKQKRLNRPVMQQIHEMAMKDRMRTLKQGDSNSDEWDEENSRATLEADGWSDDE